MAYFSNSTEGAIFDEQCAKCKYGEEPCPIALAQLKFNYQAKRNKVATKILNTIVNQEGICVMRDTFKRDFVTDGSTQPKLF